MKILKSLLLITSFILISCSSVYDNERDKLEFVKSIIKGSENCEEIIIKSKYYKKGVTLFIDDDCNPVKTIVRKFGQDALEYKIGLINAGNTLTVSAILDYPEAKIIFEFYNTGEHKDLLYRINLEFDPTYDN